LILKPQGLGILTVRTELLEELRVEQKAAGLAAARQWTRQRTEIGRSNEILAVVE
jgi:hypothetical protein